MDRLSDYDYELPPERIAQSPLPDRSASKLLHLDRRSGEISHRIFREIVDVLEPGDLLVMNDTRVTALRLFGRKPTGGQVELLLLREVEEGLFEALVKPGRRLKPGSIVELDEGLSAEIGEASEEPKRLVRFAEVEGLRERLRAIGQTPLPPYVRERLADPERYQTVYARAGGSAAAPTAGLHFTPEVLAALAKKGVGQAWVTLDVSLDTFRPVEAEDPDEHLMHGELARVPPETAAAVGDCRGRVVAVGTTVVRTLESFASGPGRLEPGEKWTRLFIRPGYEFRIVQGMLTNFHLPRTTMLMLVCSFASRDAVRSAYQDALRSDYRFLSFGDAMLIT
jgi:S-adenosylmethionine:tRNA ribosyltransferase-isomerase